MTGKLKRLLTLALALAMVLSLAPLDALAVNWDGFADRITCEWCGGTIWGDGVCGLDGGHCSEDYGNYDCWKEHHCSVCGQCGTMEYMCDTCLICLDCLENGEGSGHCYLCDTCGIDLCEECTENHTMYGGNLGICPECARESGFHCQKCTGCFEGDVELCEGSRIEGMDLCIDCCMDEGYHCDYCREHIPEGYMCEDEGDHCLDCAYGSGAQFCDSCGVYYCPLCEEDWPFNYLDNICDSCVEDKMMRCPECERVEESLDWCEDDGKHCIECCQDYICEQCGHCGLALDLEFCTDCYLCLECCRENAEAEGCSCGEYCVESTDWDEHFCSGCGVCFDEADQCEYCSLCLDCCEQESDCTGGMCVLDPEYEEHFCSDCGLCFHEADVCFDCQDAGELLCLDCCAQRSYDLGCDHGVCMNSWEWEEHWCEEHDCCFAYCTDTPQTHTHSYDADGVCSICGADRTGRPVILVQPQDRHTVVPYYYRLRNEDGYEPKVSFSLRASGDGLSYQWYTAAGTPVSGYGYSGADTPTLAVIVPTDACANPYEFYCVVSNDHGSVYSDTVRIYADHDFKDGRWRPVQDGEEYSYVTYDANGQAVTDTARYSSCHRRYCASEDLGECHAYDKTAPHRFGGWELVQEATADRLGLLKRRCMDCVASEYRQLPLLTAHEHEWEFGTDSANRSMHSSVCTVCGKKRDQEFHTFCDWIVSTEPSEESDGDRYRECTACGYYEEETLPKLAHTHFQHYDAEGQYVRTFEYCYTNLDNTVNKAFHWSVCTAEFRGAVCGQKGRVKPHHFTPWTQVWDDEANAPIRNVYERECVCGYTETLTLPDPSAQLYHKIWVQNATAYRMGDHGLEVTPVGRPGETILVRADNLSEARVFGGYWGSYEFSEYGYSGQLELTSEQSASECFTFTMPNHPVRLWASTMLHGDYTYNGQAYPHCTVSEDPVTHQLTVEDHRIYDETTAIAPTCTSNGKAADYVCTLCYQTIQAGAEIPALGHEYVLDTDSDYPASCTTVGYSGDLVCLRCGDRLKGERLTRLGHSYSDQRELIRYADCVHSGYYGWRCENDGCGHYLKDESVTIPALGHNWGEWYYTQLPTDTADGELTRACSRCNRVQTRAVPAGSQTPETIPIEALALSTNLPTVGTRILTGGGLYSTSIQITRSGVFPPSFVSGSWSWAETEGSADDLVFTDGHTYTAAVTLCFRNALYQLPEDLSTLRCSFTRSDGRAYSADPTAPDHYVLSRPDASLLRIDFYATLGDPAVPGPVDSISAQAQPGKIVVTWSAAQGADHYRIARQTTGESWILLEDNHSGTSFEDADAVPGKRYRYAVTPENTVGRGTGATSAAVTALAPLTAPGPVDSISAQAQPGKIVVTWSAAQGADHYRLARQTTGESWVLLEDNHSGISFEDTDAVPGKRYRYAVTPENAVGRGTGATSALAIALKAVG